MALNTGVANRASVLMPQSAKAVPRCGVPMLVRLSTRSAMPSREIM